MVVDTIYGALASAIMRINPRSRLGRDWIIDELVGRTCVGAPIGVYFKRQIYANHSNSIVMLSTLTIPMTVVNSVAICMAVWS